MGKKQRKKEAVVLSLAEFNGEVPAVEDELVLPSAPKGAEEWEAQGIPAFGRHAGKPARPAGGFDRDGGFERDAEPDHGWARRGPLEGAGMTRGGGFGDRGERGGFGEDRDWSERKLPPAAIEAQRGSAGELDWTQRKGPVAAEFQAPARNLGGEQEDWSRMRRGPPPPLSDGASSAPASAEIDFRDVRGTAVSAASPTSELNRDFRAARDANKAVASSAAAADVDFRDVRGTVVSSAAPVSEVEFRDVRGSAVPPASKSSKTAVGSPAAEVEFRDVRGSAVAPASKPSSKSSAVSAEPELDWKARRGQAGTAGGPSASTNGERDWNERKTAPAAKSTRGGNRGDNGGEWTRRGPGGKESGSDSGRRSSAADEEKSWRVVEGPLPQRKSREGAHPPIRAGPRRSAGSKKDNGDEQISRSSGTASANESVAPSSGLSAGA